MLNFLKPKSASTNNQSTEDEHLFCFSNYQLPIHNDILDSAHKELELFKKFLNHLLQINQSALTNKISFAENMAFRVLASIDWTKANFDELKKFIDPYLNCQHLNLNHLVLKEHGKFMNLKQHEVHEAIHEWSQWRLKLNKSIINNPALFELSFTDLNDSKASGLFRRNKNQNKKELEILSLSKLDPRIKEILSLYMIAKWSNDNSGLKFTLYFHYGIPRARLRTIQTNGQINNKVESISKCINDSGIPMSASSSFADVSLPLSPPFSSSSFKDGSFQVKYNSRPMVDNYYTKNEMPFHKPPRPIRPKQNLSISSFEFQNQSKQSNNNTSINSNKELKFVKGGILTNNNVYYPAIKKTY